MKHFLLSVSGIALLGCASQTATQDGRAYVMSYATPHAVLIDASELGEHRAGLSNIQISPSQEGVDAKLYYQPFLEAAYPDSSREVFRCFNNDETPLVAGYKSCFYHCRGVTISLVTNSAKLCPRNYEFPDVAQGMLYFYGSRLELKHSILGLTPESSE